MLKFPKQAKPDLIRIFRHQRAIPQYEITSGERFYAIERLQQSYSGLTIAGNLRDGIGMAHRIKQAVETADRCLDFKV
jgi:oxygen-dependent protoporphyrinogen oxidase